MTRGYYILGPDHRVVPVDDVLIWGRMLDERAEWRQVAHTELPNGYYVSTVFLGLGHNFCDNGPPLLFETMTFPSDDRQLQGRYATWAEAEAGHAAIVEVARWWTSRFFTHALISLRWRLRHWPMFGWAWRMDRWLKRQTR